MEDSKREIRRTSPAEREDSIEEERAVSEGMERQLLGHAADADAKRPPESSPRAGPSEEKKAHAAAAANGGGPTAKGGGGGRPPRPPNAPLSPRRADRAPNNAIAREEEFRDRSESEAGFSCVSALTVDADEFAAEFGPPTPPPPPRLAVKSSSSGLDSIEEGTGKAHKREVSFDFKVSHDGATPITAPAPPSDAAEAAVLGKWRKVPNAAVGSIVQPDLTQQPSIESLHTSTRQKVGHHVRKSTKISLADVVASPMEDEAEAAILQALETRKWEKEDDDAKYNKVMAKNAQHRRNKTILGNVPDDALEMLAREEEKAAIATKPSEDSRDTERTDGTQTAPQQRDEDEGHAGGGAPVPTFKDIATRLKRMQAAKAAMGDGETRRDAKGGKTEFLKAAKKAESRRTLGSVAGQSTSTSDKPAAKTKRKETFVQPIEKMVGAPGAKPVSAGDALVNDAAILLGEKDDNDGAFVDVESQRLDPPPVRAKENWTKLRGAVRATAALAALKEAKGATQSDETKDDANAEVMQEQQEEETIHRDEYELEDGDGGKSGGPSKHKRRQFLRYRFRQKARQSILLEVIKPKLPQIKVFLTTAIFFIILPVLLVASILFYAVGNPIAGCIDEKDKSGCASYSWWVIFIGIRQIITFTLAKGTEVFLVEVIALRTKIFVRILGPYVTLLTVQARGWPFVIFFWAVWDFAMLFGKSSFVFHWLFWQKRIAMMNAGNQAGQVTYSDMYERILIAVIVFGACVGLKRGWIALYLGKNSVRHYGKQVEKLMKKMLLISDVSHLAEEIRDSHFHDYYGAVRAGHAVAPSMHLSAIRGIKPGDEEDDDDSASDRITKSLSPSSRDNTAAAWQRLRANTEDQAGSVSKARDSDRTAGTTKQAQDTSAPRPGLKKQSRAFIDLSQSTRMKLTELVGEWEEPQVMAESGAGQEVSIQEVLQFRQAVATLDNKYPFSVPFGSFKTREACIERSQSVYEDLLLRTPESGIALPFETIALAALKPNGELDEDKAKKLLRMFRSDRYGFLTALDFVKSVDKVYKNLRTLRASIANSSQIDRAFEQIVNVFFYFVLLMITLAILNMDPVAIFMSLSAFILGFSFLFSNAASKYFEGILLILIRRPYDIGDRVAVSNPQNDTSSNGSSCWFVEGITLYTTTVRFGTTNEVATYSNGSLASMRIINANRSPKATVYIYLKFASDISYERVMVFKSVVEKFVKDRPRQWLNMSAFRATRVEADMGFIEYVLVLVHTEKWQNIGAILTSKAEASSYCLEVQKKLDMRYTAPPLPVNLEVAQKGASVFEENEGGDRATTTNAPDLGALTSLFVPAEAKKTK